MESLHRLYEPTNIHTETAYLAFVGFFVDSIGLLLFYSYSSLPTPKTITSLSQQAEPGPRGHDHNMHSVYLHALADLFVRLALLFATWMHKYGEWVALNGLVFLFAALLIIRSILPLFQTMALTLLQTTPPHLNFVLEQCLREVRYQFGVLECRNLHWWTQSPGVIVGSLHIRVTADANEQAILVIAHKNLKNYIKYLTVQIEKHQPVQWLEASPHPSIDPFALLPPLLQEDEFHQINDAKHDRGFIGRNLSGISETRLPGSSLI